MYAATADASFGAVALSGLAGITAGHDTIDWDTSRTGYDTDTNRFYLGGKVDCKLGAHVPFAYALAQWDQNAGQTEMLP
ncbi:MAG: hypothetical protein EBR07_04820, partial [Planctomycetes bacterium]|nr:hypothetical protein [Planctomycetota bacterium]